MSTLWDGRFAIGGHGAWSGLAGTSADAELER